MVTVNKSKATEQGDKKQKENKLDTLSIYIDDEDVGRNYQK